MMEQPKMPMLTLDLQKTATYNTVPLRLTQGDKGYIQPFTLTNAFQQYTVTADVLGFRAMKPDGKYIEIQNEPGRFSLADGVWNFSLPDELTQAIGTVTGAYFYVKSGSNIVASTTKFNYSISAAWSSDEESNNYVTKLEELTKKLQEMVSAGATTVTGLNNYSNEAKATLTKILNDFTASVNTWKTTTTTAVDKVLADEKTALQKAQSDWNSEYNKVVAYYANMATEWTAKKASYDKLVADEIAKMETAKTSAINDFTNKSSAKLIEVSNSLADLETKKTATLNKVASDGTAKVAEIQKSYDTLNGTMHSTLNTFKTDTASALKLLATDKATALSAIETEKKTALEKLVAEKNTAIAKIGTDSTAKLTAIQSDYDTFKSGMKTTLDGLLKDVPALESRVQALTTQLDDIDIVSVKAVADKATADVAGLTKSMVKSATVNGDTKVLPDTAGNLALTIQNPDLSPYALDTDVTKKIDDIQVGGRNYILNSDKYLTSNTPGYFYSATKINGSDLSNRIITLSLDVEIENVTALSEKQRAGIELPVYRADGTNIWMGAWWYPEIGQSHKGRISATYDSAGMAFTKSGLNAGIFVQGIVADKIKVGQPMLEFGNKSGDWSPAPEDISAEIDTKISKLTKSVNGITPDASGNISLPQPDLTPYATNTDLTANYALKSQVTTAETNAKNYADTKKSEAQSYTDSKLSGVLKSWTGTQAQYDAITTKDPNTQYLILEVV